MMRNGDRGGYYTVLHHTSSRCYTFLSPPVADRATRLRPSQVACPRASTRGLVAGTCTATRSRFQLRPEKRDLPGHARERREVQLIRRSRTAGRHATAALPPAAGGEAVSRGGEGGGLAGACGAGARAGTIAV